jgi:glycine/D-amino acid oxidase-like deaminating enzyme
MATYNGGPVELRCERLLYCTNAFTNTITGQQLATPGRGQVIVTSPISGLRLRGTFHYDEGYYYFRNVGDRVLLGGARNIAFAEEQTTEMVTTEVIQQRLRAFLHDHLLAGCSYDIAYQWSGIMAFTPNKQPIITSPANNTMAVIGCNGMGVALLPVLAEEVATHF